MSPETELSPDVPEPEAVAPERSAPVDLLWLPRAITGALADLRSIADGIAGAVGDIRTIAERMRTLPDLLDVLTSIDSQVEVMNSEVSRMRAGVDEMRDEVEGVRASVAPLEAEFAATRAGLERLEPHLDGVAKAIRPLHRLTTLARGRRRGEPIDDEDALLEAEETGDAVEVAEEAEPRPGAGDS